MNDRDNAVEFVRRFAAGDMEGLRELLHPEFRFHGPLLETDTADAYIASLADSVEAAKARILHVGADGEAVSIFYEYVKPARRLTVAQMFRFRDGLISETVVVFDTQGFA